MAKGQEFNLNDNADFIFQYDNRLFKLRVGVTNGVILLKELHKNKNKIEEEILNIINIQDKETEGDNENEGPTNTNV